MQDQKDIEALSAEEKRALLRRLLQEKNAKSQPDLAAHSEVPIPVSGGTLDLELVKNPRTIFLTGTTGFVGAFVLRELLRRTEATIYCLARADNDRAAAERIRSNLENYGIWDEKLASRIKPLAGDLSNQGLGLSEQQLQVLKRDVDVIYHVAAVVNLTSKYSVLKPSNVDGTLRILELATEGRVKALHYLSTYAVFDSIHNMGKTFAENDEPAQWRALSNGYAESKWVAERLVRRAQAQGLPATIYRVGWVIGHSLSGAWNKSDFIPRLIQCCTRMRMACSLGAMTLTPVDFLADSLVSLSRQPQYLGRIFHLSNNKRYTSDDIFEWTRAFGYPIEKVDYETFDHTVRTLGSEIAIAPMLMFLEQAAGLDVKPADWFTNEPRYDASATVTTLAREGITCPEPGSALMAVYLQHFLRNGYVDPPTDAASNGTNTA